VIENFLELGGCPLRTDGQLRAASNTASRPEKYSRDVTRTAFGANLWFRSAEGAMQTVAGYEAMHAIRKGQIRWLPKGDVVGQVQFIQRILGIAA
jgi:hypothetical protein